VSLIAVSAFFGFAHGESQGPDSAPEGWRA